MARYRAEVERFKRALTELEEKHGFTIGAGESLQIIDEDYNLVWEEDEGYVTRNLADEQAIREWRIVVNQINDALNRRY